MFADLKPYPQYDGPPSPYGGPTPSGWSVDRLRSIVEMRVSNVDKLTNKNELPVRLCNYTDVYKHERIREQLRFMNASASKEEVQRFRLRRNDIVITKDSESWTDIGVPALVEYEAPDLVCGYHLAVLRSGKRMVGPYLLRALQTDTIAAQLYVEANGVTRYGLSQGAIKGISIPVPPLEEQDAIVRFLDYANGRLERVIRGKRKVIALLTEQKQAIIQRAVTRGIDPSVPLKPSGIPWLGDIPAHWEVVRTKNVFRLRTEKSGFDHGMELLSIYTHIGVRPRKDLAPKGNKASTTDNYWVVEKGDLIVNKLLAWMGAIGVSQYSGVTRSVA